MKKKFRRNITGGVFSGKTAEDIQDRIFQKMSADRKLEIASHLWLLAKELDSDKIDFRYGINRPKTPPCKNRRNP